MKNTLFLVLVFLSFKSYAQKPLAYTGVVHVDSTISKLELYNRAKLWFVDHYNSAKDVIQLDDPANGVIIGKAITPYHSKVYAGNLATAGHIGYTVKISVKDGRYKYDLSDFIHSSDNVEYYRKDLGIIYEDTFKHIGFIGGKNTDRKIWNELLDYCDNEKYDVVKSLKQFMDKPKAITADNW